LVLGQEVAETLQAFERSMDLIFENAKVHRCRLCCLVKMTFNESHLGMCIWLFTRGHFITIKIFPGGSAEGKG